MLIFKVYPLFQMCLFPKTAAILKCKTNNKMLMSETYIMASLYKMNL